MAGTISNEILRSRPPPNITYPKDGPIHESITEMFVPNGLLGPSRNPTFDENAMKSADFEISGIVSETLLTRSWLVSNGPPSKTSSDFRHQSLSSKSSDDNSSSRKTSIPNELPSGTQCLATGPSHSDVLITSLSAICDVLPSAFEAFGVPVGLLSSRASLPMETLVAVSSRSKFSIRATTFDGNIIHMKKKPKISKEARKRTLPTTTAEKMGSLLDVPIHRLMDELSAATAAKLRRPDQLIPKNVNPVEDTLWVDRYRPYKFTELVGNERVARETMAWVQQWDWCVFGRKKGRKRQRGEDSNNNENDEYHRPREKLLLLSGPPGLGKTSLAHVIARHAGYETMEINASDARSGSIVDDRIRPALESGSSVGSTKPVLLIIDEIDGATGAGENTNGFIQKLVQLTYDRPQKKQRSGKSHDPGVRPLLRPIICICNDQNASSLGKLKLHAYHIRFQRPADIHPVKRLREVCELEGLKTDPRALTALVGLAKGDLRSCLNTLQFIKSRKEEVTETDIRNATVGMKETDTSLNAVLNNLFNPLPKSRVKELAIVEKEEAKYVARLSREIEGSGRESSIALGCFGHYVKLRHHDANFMRYEQANDWLVTFDVLSAGMYNNGDFGLIPYLPYILVPFYPLFQERGSPHVEGNQADWENHQLTRANEEVLKTLSRCLRNASTRLNGDFRHLLSTPTLQMEFVPLINRIISPPLRPVNSQVIRAAEKVTLSRLVSIMVSLELRFFQERGEDGQLSYRLDPPIDVFITYDGKRAVDIAVSRYAVRHLVAGEIDSQLIARNADIVEKGKTVKKDVVKKSRPYKNFEDGEHVDTLDELPQGSLGPLNKRRKVDERDIADRPPTDFFGRVISVPSINGANPMVQKIVEKYRVTYRFREGNSAAVRKPVKFSSFL